MARLHKLQPSMNAAELKNSVQEDNKWKLQNLNVTDKETKAKNKATMIYTKINELKSKSLLCKTQRCYNAINNEMMKLIEKYNALPNAANNPPIQ